MNQAGKLNNNYIIRKGNLDDKDGLMHLYQKVAAIKGGLARTVNEITDAYITNSLQRAVDEGIIFVALHEGCIIGSFMEFKLEPRVFSHVLTDGTILVDPDYQKRGIGEALIRALQEEVMHNRTEIYRVEIIARESNPAINGLYTRTGFIKEGEFKGRIQGISGTLESDIPMAWINPHYKSRINSSIE